MGRSKTLSPKTHKDQRGLNNKAIASHMNVSESTVPKSLKRPVSSSGLKKREKPIGLSDCAHIAWRSQS